MQVNLVFFSSPNLLLSPHIVLPQLTYHSLQEVWMTWSAADLHWNSLKWVRVPLRSLSATFCLLICWNACWPTGLTLPSWRVIFSSIIPLLTFSHEYSSINHMHANSYFRLCFYGAWPLRPDTPCIIPYLLTLCHCWVGCIWKQPPHRVPDWTCFSAISTLQLLCHVAVG